MKFAFIAISFLLILSSCSSEQPKNEDSEPIPELEETLIINAFSGDTLETGVAHYFDSIGVQNEKGAKYLNTKYNQAIWTKIEMTDNYGQLQARNSKSFIKDSSAILSPPFTDSLPPQEIQVDPIITTVKPPVPKSILPSVHKDNAQYDIRYLSTDQGLATNMIQDIVKDSRGFVWMATDKGLIQYNGHTATTYDTESGLPESYITCLALDKDENLWLGTRNSGFVKYDGEKFYNYPIDSIALDREVAFITFDDHNEMWSTIQFGGVAHFDGEKFHTYNRNQGLNTSRPTTSIVIDDDDTKWITGFGYGLYSIEKDGTIRRYHEKYANPLSGYINDIILDADGNKVLAHWGAVFSVIKDDSVTAYAMDNLPIPVLLTDQALDKNGNIWMSGYGSGIFRYNSKDNEVQFFGEPQGLSTAYTTAVFVDENNMLWIATEGGGVCMLQLNSFQNINRYRGLESDFINEVMESKNGVTYYGTNKGVIKQDSTGTYIHTGLQGNPKTRVNHQVLDLQLDHNGSLWIGSMNSGVIRIEENGMWTRLSHSSGFTRNPNCMDTTSNGHVWIAGMGASLTEVMEMDSNINRISYEQGLALHNISELLITDDDIFWLGSHDKGIAKIVRDSITYYTTKEGLKSNVINHFGEDALGRIWICTEEGLNYVEKGEIKTVDIPELNLNVKGIIQDEVGRYWITTERSLICFEPRVQLQETWSLDDFKLHVFDKGNGLNSSSFLKNSMFINSKNELMMGSEGGLIVRDLNSLKFDITPPDCYLNSIQLNGAHVDFRKLRDNGALEDVEGSENIKMGDILKFNNYPSTLELPHYINHLTFEFSGMNWDDPHKMTFYYFLDGYEENWNVSRTNNIADYRNLSYGEYEFHLKAEARDGSESEEFTYKFEIMRPWWHTWWARIIFVLLFLALLAALIKWRTTELRKRQKLLESEIEQATARLRHQKEKVEAQKEEVEKAHEELNTKNQEILDSINYAKRIQNAILPSDTIINEQLPQNFVYYLPKDIVAGDFYWLEIVDNGVLIASADCTGHGVPGAMVSVICNSGLNRSVREFAFTDPGKVLDKTRELVIEEFKKSDEDVKDGMDIAICHYKETKSGAKLKYAGANNPLWIFRKGEEEVEEIKANKQPIGEFDHPTPFTTQEVELNSGDTFYIFSDGYADQFGGEKGKKMKASNFKKLLGSIQSFEMPDQLRKIQSSFEEWKGEFEQLDDVCVIGVRVP